MVKNTYIIIISSFTRYSYISLIYILIRKKKILLMRHICYYASTKNKVGRNKILNYFNGSK